MKPALDRFWAKVDKSGECWVWTGKRMKEPWPYGRFYVNGRSGPEVSAHRWIYEQINGALPDAAQVCHRCDNPPCVRPDHLFSGTAFDNMRDAYQKGRTYLPFGQNHHSAKLDADSVVVIRQMGAAGMSSRYIAEQFAVNRSTIGKVLRGATWRHLLSPTER